VLFPRAFSWAVPVVVAALAAGCGEGSPPTVPPTPPPPLYPVAVNVYYDENENGLRDASERAVVPNVEVSVVGRTGVSAATNGYVTIAGVPAGSHTVVVSSRRPPFYLPGAPTTINVPQVSGVEVSVATVLPIGSNFPGTYMGFGDSITDGDGSRDGYGYRRLLERKLGAALNEGEVINRGISATRSLAGAGRIDRVLSRVQPAYALILYGTNDWNEGECRVDFPCFTISSLRGMVKSAKARETLPVVGTILPVNVGYDFRVPAARQEWVKDMNALIGPMAREEGAVLVDFYAAFMREPDYKALFYDHVHPNDSGYEIMATEWFKAITQPPAASPAAEGADLEPPPPTGKKFYGDPPPLGPGEE